MLEKLVVGALGSGVSSLLSGLFGGGKASGGSDVSGDMFASLLGKTQADGSSVAATDTTTGDATTQEAASMLHDMTSDGLAGYWRHMIKQMREKVMEGMGVTEESLAAMKPDERAAMEAKINDAVKEAVAKAMGVNPDEAGKMMAQADGVTGVSVANQIEAKKAYKNEVVTV